MDTETISVISTLVFAALSLDWTEALVIVFYLLLSFREREYNPLLLTLFFTISKASISNQSKAKSLSEKSNKGSLEKEKPAQIWIFFQIEEGEGWSKDWQFQIKTR